MRGAEISYWDDFDTRAAEWATVDIPFSHFIPRYRGMRLEGPVLDLASVSDMGVMIYDKLKGPFQLRMATVHAR